MYDDVLPDRVVVGFVQWLHTLDLYRLRLDFGDLVQFEPPIPIIFHDVIINLPLYQVFVTGGEEYFKLQLIACPQCDEE